MDRHEKILKHLQILAEDVIPVRSAKIASALVYKRDIISLGVCQYKTHPFQQKYGKNEKSIYLHAETDAIQNALARYRDPDLVAKSTLYVARVKRPDMYSNSWIGGLAKPCCACEQCIAAFNVQKVIYTTNDGDYAFL